jgi:hypothetical protein
LKKYYPTQEVWRFFQKSAGLELYSPLRTRRHLCPMNKNDRMRRFMIKRKRKIRIEERKKKQQVYCLKKPGRKPGN